MLADQRYVCASLRVIYGYAACCLQLAEKWPATPRGVAEGWVNGEIHKRPQGLSLATL